MTSTTTAATTAQTAAAAGISSTLRGRDREGRQLVRLVGPGAPAPFSPLPGDLLELVARESSTTGPAWRWDCGEGDDLRRRYDVPPGSRSLADLALSQPGLVASWPAALSEIGAALGRLHAVRPTPGVAEGEPQGLRRLALFLDGVVPEGRPAAQRQRFVDALCPGLRDELVVDTRRAAAPPPGAGVRSHGWAGLGRWYPSGSGAVGLVGEDLGIAAREHDLAAVLAQVVELRFFRPEFEQVVTLDDARAALLAGYPAPISPDALDREVRLGVVRHVADIVVHADCPDDEPARWAALVGSLPPVALP
ncbi:hypothetical protein ABFT23_11130 [Nocardioides sp. C4-1]|uniref:hypothetical protein n=1 Tax=Nocardioides sp. C4-1 TaxID=3151851 RepID=UPI003262F01C